MKNPSVRPPLKRIVQRVLGRARRFPELSRRLSGIQSVGISGVSSAQMARINRRYRSQRAPTDVLSFPAPPALRELGDLGDLMICVPIAKKQAKEQGHRLEWELEVLVVHGLLHLLGFDHEKSAKEALKMRRWEKRLLGKIKSGLIGRASSGISQRRQSR